MGMSGFHPLNLTPPTYQLPRLTGLRWLVGVFLASYIQFNLHSKTLICLKTVAGLKVTQSGVLAR